MVKSDFGHGVTSLMRAHGEVIFLLEITRETFGSKAIEKESLA
jgi:hypothetical protein